MPSAESPTRDPKARDCVDGIGESCWVWDQEEPDRLKIKAAPEAIWLLELKSGEPMMAVLPSAESASEIPKSGLLLMMDPGSLPF